LIDKTATRVCYSSINPTVIFTEGNKPVRNDPERTFRIFAAKSGKELGRKSIFVFSFIGTIDLSVDNSLFI
jgi:hypothetical protein